MHRCGCEGYIVTGEAALGYPLGARAVRCVQIFGKVAKPHLLMRRK
jgi:hypothetical protein